MDEIQYGDLRKQLESLLALLPEGKVDQTASGGQQELIIEKRYSSSLYLPDLAAKAEAIYKGRRNREKVFAGLPIFADPAWDLLLDLFIARVRQRRVSVSSATIAACVAPTTGLRWITTLIERDLIRRAPDPFDRRKAYLELTQRGFDLSARAIAAA